MKVSIITVTYNSEKTLEDTIQSVLSQDYPNIEYIVVDGHSTDKTVSIIESYGNKIDTFISEPDKGIYDAMNKGICLATGDLVAILNSDDFYATPDVITKIAQKFTPEIDAVYADLIYISATDKSKVIRRWQSGQYAEGLFRKGWMPPHPTFVVRKTVYDRFGLFTDQLRSAADYEIMLRFIHKHKIKLAYLPETTVHMRAGGASNKSLKNRIRANREDREAWRMNGLNPGILTLIRKPLSKISQFLKK